MILRTVRALISLTVRAACKITTSNKPAKSHRDKSKVRVKKIRNNTHSEDG